MSSVVVIGGCIVDLISYVKRFPRPGETIPGLHFSKGCGGKGANQCVMAQKLGASTALIAKLGDDGFGHEYLEIFKASGVHTEHMTFAESSQTSTASISVSEDGENCIVFVPGAINDLSADDVNAAEELIKSAKVLLGTYECPLVTLMTAFKLARKHGVKTVLNAAPSTDESYEQLYPLVDFLSVNEIEAEDATGLTVKAVDDSESIFKKFHDKGCCTVILTLGKQGAAYKSKHDERYTFVPARQVTAVDCTGAGDAFMGSFVYFLSEHPKLDLKNVIQKSCEVATMSVLKKGTQSSFPNREELPATFFDCCE